MHQLYFILRASAKSCVYVLLILALIQPFGIDQIKEGRILFILSETAIAFLSVVLSTGIATALTYKRFSTPRTIQQFVLHRAILYVVNVPILATLLLIYNGWFHMQDPWAYLFANGHLNYHGIMELSMYVFFISVILAIFDVFSFRNQKLQNELEEVKAINALLEKRQEKIQEEDKTKESAEHEELVPAMVKIVGQGIGSELEVIPSNIIYVESMANYTSICYIAGNETKTVTLRTTLKQIRETLNDVDCIVQCHRAFLVNINFVISLQSNNSSYLLQMFGMDKQIPVSRANTETIKQKLKV